MTIRSHLLPASPDVEGRGDTHQTTSSPPKSGMIVAKALSLLAIMARYMLIALCLSSSWYATCTPCIEHATCNLAALARMLHSLQAVCHSLISSYCKHCHHWSDQLVSACISSSIALVGPPVSTGRTTCIKIMVHSDSATRQQPLAKLFKNVNAQPDRLTA